eukprot:GHVN01031940.1.p1 GENE.GHVN01031940.1~~GHVN01031940.1.p1  ORF type:complete len:437 (+),score=105.33 GHVN01031940.1:1331-2641(+)
MSSSTVIHSSHAIIRSKASSEFEPKFDATKRVGRYWAGKAPEADDEPDIEEESDEEADEEPRAVDTSLQDRRLKRLQEIAEENEEEGGADPVERRRRHEAVIYTAPDDLTEKGDDKEGTVADMTEIPDGGESDDAAASRRDKLRKAALLRRKQEEERLEALAQEEESESEYESDYDSDPEAVAGARGLIKPVFVPASRRETVKEQERLAEEEAIKEREMKMRLEDRRQETHKMVVDAIKQEIADEAAAAQVSFIGDSDTEMPPSEDEDMNDEAEYELWKIRELNRIKRDKEERDAREKFLADMERRRHMTDEERRESDRILDENAPKKGKKSKYTFMQKYYHQGAYFQHLEESLYRRDYNLPTAEDKVDKKAAPRPMKLRRGEWGKGGQTKHTHLADIDTTDFSAPWSQNDKIRLTMQQKMAGVKDANDLSGSRKV